MDNASKRTKVPHGVRQTNLTEAVGATPVHERTRLAQGRAVTP